MDNNLSGGTNMKTTLPEEDDFKGVWPYRKTTTKKDNITGDDLTGRQTQWKKNLHKQHMKLSRPKCNNKTSQRRHYSWKQL